MSVRKAKGFAVCNSCVLISGMLCAGSLRFAGQQNRWRLTFQDVDISPPRVERLLEQGIYYHPATVEDILSLSDEKIRSLLSPKAPFYA